MTLIKKKLPEKNCNRNKQVMTIGEKLKILELLKKGEKKGYVARFNVNESTIRSIQNNK